jgi:arsenate reductase (thioredoxin)
MRRAIRERNILFLCEDNACLSQMVEAVAKRLGPPKTRIFSAGIKPRTIRPHVYRLMEELGINISGQAPKTLSDVPLNEIDLVVSFGDADKKCGPLPAKTKVEHWPITQAEPSPADELKLTCHRQERDEIDKRVFALFLDHWRNVA